ncbi:MAG: GH25 family lysozyme [Bacteroidaceae bacterium]|nr:GH25 family lysozyme [Prevotellaceae bacterium]MDY5631383.1 GH25 family lysozyme [Bacteroidaceae bacterium]
MKSLLILLSLVLTASPTSADDKNKTTEVLVESEPDPYIQPLAPEDKLLALEEYTFKVHHHAFAHYRGTIQGIDVSHHQGNINWQAVALNPHARYAYIKATENVSLVDKRYYENIREARKAGVLVGSYHFYSPNAATTPQLLNLTRTMPDLSSQDLIPLIDVEIRGRMSLKAFRDNLRQFLIGVEKYYGVKPMIYTGLNFYNKYLQGAFEDYKYMIARYGDEVPDPEGNPKFIIWQYSERGSMPGIRSNVDLSTFVDNYTLKEILIKDNK